MSITADEHCALVADIYGAALDPAGWPGVLETLMRFVGASGSALIVTDPRASTMLLSGSAVDASARESYARYYSGLDRTTTAILEAAPGQVVPHAAIVPRDGFLASEFYADWLRPLDMGDGVFVKLKRSAAAATWVALGGPFGRESFVTPDRLAFLRRIAPHLVRAVEVQARLGIADVDFWTLHMHEREPVIALAVLGSGARLLHGNASFEDLARRGRILVRNDRVDVPGLASSRALRAALAATGTGSEGPAAGAIMLLRGQDTAPPLVLRVHPVGLGLVRGLWPGATAILLISDPTAPPRLSARLLQEGFGLTPAEIAVAGCLVRSNGGLREIAWSLAVSHSTVRTHVLHIYEKTGVHRQSDLVRLLLQAAPDID